MINSNILKNIILNFLTFITLTKKNFMKNLLFYEVHYILKIIEDQKFLKYKWK